MSLRKSITIFIVLLLVVFFASASLFLSRSTVQASNPPGLNTYMRPAPNYDLNLSRNLNNTRQATANQLAALEQLKSNLAASNLTARWNDFGGSVDVIRDFASQSFAGAPEQAGRSFIAANANLFGVSNVNDLRLFSQKDALG